MWVIVIAGKLGDETSLAAGRLWLVGYLRGELGGKLRAVAVSTMGRRILVLLLLSKL